jgi:hypothetical protein
MVDFKRGGGQFQTWWWSILNVVVVDFKRGGGRFQTWWWSILNVVVVAWWSRIPICRGPLVFFRN